MSIAAMASCWGDDFPVEAASLSPPAIRVVALAIADVVNDTYHNEFYGSLPNLAKKVGLSRDTVRRVMKHLVESGVIVVKEQREGQTTKYSWIGPPRGISAGSGEQPRETSRAHPAKQSAPIPIDTNEPSLAQLRLSEFDEWWAIWPRKVAKGGARKAFDVARRKVDFETLMERVRALAARYRTMTADERNFVPYPERWLSKEHWANEDVADGTTVALPVFVVRPCVMCAVPQPSDQECRAHMFDYSEAECPWR